jgi:hypothetical protein
MALFTDGPAATMEDLAAQDSQLLTLANAEGIDLTVKLRLAHEAVGIDLEELLQDGSGLRPAQVVVTPALRLWHTYRTLELVYRDAYHSQLNDRYAAKRDQFRELSQWAYNRVRQAGVGITLAPIPQAAPPSLTASSGGLAEGTYYAAMAWANAAGEEGACSPTAALEVTSGGFTARPPAAPDGVTGWNVYAGTAPESMSRQNGGPLALDAEWPATTLSESGARPGSGQSPRFLHAMPRVLRRG